GEVIPVLQSYSHRFTTGPCLQEEGQASDKLLDLRLAIEQAEQLHRGLMLAFMAPRHGDVPKNQDDAFNLAIFFANGSAAVCYRVLAAVTADEQRVVCQTCRAA